jgi:hypothetical protein
VTDTIPGVTIQVFISCTRPMLPYIAMFSLPFIPSHPIIFSIAFGFPHSQSISILCVFILIVLGANPT